MASSANTPPRPKVSRQVSRVPGGFEDTDDDLSPVEASSNEQEPQSALPQHPRPAPKHAPAEDNSLITASSDAGGIALPEEASTLEEKEIRRRLMEEDSTFLPPLSPFAGSGRYDTLTSGSARSSPATVAGVQSDTAQTPNEQHSGSTLRQSVQYNDTPRSAETPSGMYATPAPGRENSSPESMSSSPTVQAAARRPSRSGSTISTNKLETVDNGRELASITGQTMGDEERTPRKDLSQDEKTPTSIQQASHEDLDEATNGDTESTDLDSTRSRKRPKLLTNRVATQSSSYSTYTTTSIQSDSNLTMGADYALQTGGAAPFGGSTSSRPRMEYSRTTSLGSMLSGISGISDDDMIGFQNRTNDETHASSEDGPSTIREEDLTIPITPRAVSTSTEIPTDTVLAQRVKDVEVPATAAREYRDRHRSPSPDKRPGAPAPSTNRNGRVLTLKEQSGTIDRLTKENFDLKMKITFLNDSLKKRSPEGVAGLVGENADLKAAKVTSAKEIRDLKRTIRDLERTLRGKEGELTEILRNGGKETEQAPSNNENMDALEEELLYLKERVVSYDVELERVRHERYEQKRETDRLVKLLDYRKSQGSDAGAREEIDMWKERCESEAARREQADQENHDLREQLWRLENGQPITNGYHQHEDSGRRTEEAETSDASSRTIVETIEQLRHDNNSLRREVAAQMSMLTSRNREKQVLDQEIEELRLAARRDGARSTAGDSTLDPSVSRTHGRPASSYSNATRTTQLSDAERESYDTQIAGLRDKNAALELEVREVSQGLNQCLEELEGVDTIKHDHVNLQRIYEQEIAAATEDMQTLQAERDEALNTQEELECQIRDLDTAAQAKITSLEDELQERDRDLDLMDAELKTRDNALNALRVEVRNTGRSLGNLESELTRREVEVAGLTYEIETTHDDYKKLDSEYRELKSMNDRCLVQNESHQKEIAFLREEQDTDKIRIGDLQAERTGLNDHVKELESRLAQEKHQREVIDSKEKREVQKIMDDLNREVSDGKAESRDMRQNLQSREVEVTTFKERLFELESNLKEVLGEPGGTRSSFLTSITKLQKECESTTTELEMLKDTLSQKENLLRNRDALLESHGLESKKLSELLDRERQGRRADQAQHEQWKKSHQHTTRTVTQKDQRITELEHDRQATRKKITTLETQFKDQLRERNQLLLDLWDRLAPMCGSDWQHQHNLVNNHVPTLEVVSSQLPGFSKNLVAATKTIEGLMMGFKGRIRAVERDLWKEYQQLETNLESRVKKMDQLEATVQSNRVTGTFTAAPEIAKLRGENRLLKSEIATLQKQELQTRSPRSGSSSTRHATSNGGNNLAAPPPTLSRSYTSSHIETLERAVPSRTSSTSTMATLSKLGPTEQLTSQPIEPSQQRLNHRIKELERRLKAEREARLLDRTAARKRLEEGMEVNEMLKSELEREKGRKAR